MNAMIFPRASSPPVQGQSGPPARIKLPTVKLGLGTREYEMVDVLPVEQIERAPIGYIPAR
jgi:hypothetical protein